MKSQNSATFFHSACGRTLQLWLLSNLGGTLWLVGYFAVERLTDYSVGLFTGLLAALVSLVAAPLVVPFFAALNRFAPGLTRLAAALASTALVYLLVNTILLYLLPINTLTSLLEITLPYLVVALAIVGRMYVPTRRPQLSAPMLSEVLHLSVA